MNYIEYGKENRDAIILLHGGGLSWWNYKKTAEILRTKYYVILPMLDGHANSDKEFTSIEDNAAEIIEFIDMKFNGSVLMIGGLSLGGQILLEILSQRKNICKYAIVESALVVPSRLTYSLIKPTIKICYGLIRYKWFSKLQFKALRINPIYFDDYYRDSCDITKENMIAFLEANSLYRLKESIRDCVVEIRICVGTKENCLMRKSASIIHKILKKSSLEVFPKMYHGDLSINHADIYVSKIVSIVKQECFL